MELTHARINQIELHCNGVYWYIISHWDDGSVDRSERPFHTYMEARRSAKRSYWRDVPIIRTGGA